MHPTEGYRRAPAGWRGSRAAAAHWRTGRRRLSAGGFSLIEMVISLAIILVMAAIALPFLYGYQRTYHLTQGATGASGAIQATRYQAIMTGCPYSITFTAGTTTYQVQTESLTGTPPACASTWSNVGAPTLWTTYSDVSANSTMTLQFCPNGTQTDPTVTPPCSPQDSVTWGSLVLSNGYTTNTITVSGVGNVKVTQP